MQRHHLQLHRLHQLLAEPAPLLAGAPDAAARDGPSADEQGRFLECLQPTVRSSHRQ